MGSKTLITSVLRKITCFKIEYWYDLRPILSPAGLTAGLFLIFFNPLLSVGAVDLELQWNRQLESPIHLPPVIAGDHVIATTAKGMIHAFDKISGELVWRTEKSVRYWDRSLLVHRDMLIVGSSGGILQALSIAGGKLIWQVELGIDVQVRPLAIDGTLYVATTHVGTGLKNDPNGKAAFYAIDANTGEIRWHRRTENYALQRPSYFNGVLYLAGSYYDPGIEVDEGGPMRVSAVTEDGGEILWEHKAIDGFVKAIYADDKSVVYVGYQDFLMALDSKNGRPRWRLDTGNWTPSLLGSDGVIYFGSATTQVFAVSSANGDKYWQFDIGGGSFNYLLGEPVLENGVLYFLTQKGDIYALDAQSGKAIWVESSNIDARAGIAVDGNSLATGYIDGSLLFYNFQ